MTPGRRWVAAAVWLALSLDGRAYAGAVDPALLPILSGQAPIESFGSTAFGVLPGAPPVSGPLLSVTLRFTGRLADLRAAGLRIGSVMGEIVTAEVSAAELSALTLIPGVISIEAARAVAPLLDVSVTDVGADLIRSRRTDGWNGYTGRGVLVGLIDTGLDLTHADFRKPDGTTRVVALWDQSTGVGRPPLGFSYGTECRTNQIDARECPEIDRHGHGTHVAGIAAGNGRATGGEKPAYRYVGIAPEADLVIVKLASLNANRVIDALAYLDRKAAEAGRPLVANISMGASLGAHDGTSAFERALDAFTGPPGAPGTAPGRAVVTAAGNGGASDTHTGGCLSPTTTGCSGSVGFIVPSGSTRLSLDLWYTGGGTVGVTVTSACGGHRTAEAVPSPEGTVARETTACGETITISGTTVAAENGDGHTAVTLSGNGPLTAGVWSLSLRALAFPSSGTIQYDLWSAATDSGKPATFSAPDPRMTIEIPATATSAITVVPWVSKLRWTSLVGDREYRGETLGALATTAARGPRRSCSVCPPMPKPDIAAPGLGIMSSLSSRIDEKPFETATSSIDDVTDPDRVHYIQQGSSMAAPHVTGTVALMFQIDPTLTTNRIKDILRASAVVVPEPDPDRWGAGGLDAKSAVTSDPGRASIIDRPPVPPAGVAVVSVRSGLVRLVWEATPDLDLRGYRIYRRDASSLDTSLLTPIPINALAYEDTDGLINETAYDYMITAVDLANVESGPSAAARGVPTAGEGSVGLCFIATAAYGTPWHPRVAALRHFRDRRLLTLPGGRAFVAAYERFSPPLARVIAPRAVLRAATRAVLAPLVVSVERPRAAAAVLGLALLGAAVGFLRRRAPA